MLKERLEKETKENRIKARKEYLERVKQGNVETYGLAKQIELELEAEEAADKAAAEEEKKQQERKANTKTVYLWKDRVRRQRQRDANRPKEEPVLLEQVEEAQSECSMDADFVYDIRRGDGKK